MPVTRKWVQSLKKGSPQRQHYEIVLKDMMANDEWSTKIFKDVGVLLTAHPSGRVFLKASVESHKKLGFWLCLAYDNYWEIKYKHLKYDKIMPERNVFDQINTFVVPNAQTWGGVLFPYAWLLYLGIHTLSSFKYILCSNGDCVIEKPEGFPKLLKMFEDSGADIFPIGWEQNNGRPLLNTTSFLAKSEAIKAIMNHFMKHLIGIDNYEKYTDRLGNTESRFHIACDELGLKILKPEENPIDTQVSSPGVGTWYKEIGFRHIHAEYNKAYRKKGIPPHHKFLDGRYMKAKIALVKAYHNETDPEKKQKILETWWDAK